MTNHLQDTIPSSYLRYITLDDIRMDTITLGKFEQDQPVNTILISDDYNTPLSYLLGEDGPFVVADFPDLTPTTRGILINYDNLLEITEYDTKQHCELCSESNVYARKEISYNQEDTRTESFKVAHICIDCLTHIDTKLESIKEELSADIVSQKL